MARGDVVSAAQAQPVGVALFTCAAMLLPICVLGCLRGWSALPTLKELRLARLGAIIAVSALLSWSARLLAIYSA
jgi:hypothetical protein